MKIILLKRRIAIFLVLILIENILTNNINIDNKEKPSKENILINDDYQTLYINYTSHLKIQQEILGKINSLVLKKSNEIGDIIKNISNLQSERLNKTSILKSYESSNDHLYFKIKESIQENYSSHCNQRRECLNIIDIEDYFIMNIEKDYRSTNNSQLNMKSSIIQNDIFKIQGLFDVIDRKQEKEKIDSTEPEFIIDFLVIDFKNLITRNPTLFSNLIFKRHSSKGIDHLILILVLTNKSLNIFDYNYNLLENSDLNLKSNILKSDLSFFEEDNSLIYITQNFDINYFTVDFDLIALAHKLNIIDRVNNKGEILKVEFRNLFYNI